MARRLFIIALIASMTIPMVGENKSRADDNLSKTFQTIVSGFLSGETSPGLIAYVADGEFHEAIPDKAQLKKTYDKCTMSFMKVLVVDDRGMAVINARTVLSNGKTEWHTFVCKSVDSHWSIISWHSDRA